jgi:putative ABC transport system ATP-binding protein
MGKGDDNYPGGFKFARLGQNFIEFEVAEGIDVVGSLALDTDTTNNGSHNLWAAFNVAEEYCVFKDITHISNRNSVEPRTLPKDGYLAQTTPPHSANEGIPIQLVPGEGEVIGEPFQRHPYRVPSSRPTMALLSLSGIERHYVTGDVLVRALDGVDLEIEEGEVVMLLGPSGSGKTTLLNVVSALDSPTGGEYRFDGSLVPQSDESEERLRVSIPTPHPLLIPLTAPPASLINLGIAIVTLPVNTYRGYYRGKQLEAMTAFRRENVGYIFQFFNLLGDLTVLENVLLAQDIHGGRDTKRAVEMLNLVGLGDKENRFPSELSGGEQQRVAIARSLAKKPKLLLGDEPTGNLDSETTAQVMKVLVKACRKEKITAIIVTHDLALTKYATRVIHIDSGKLIRDEPGGRATLHATMDTAEAVAGAAVGAVEKAAKAVGGMIAGVVSGTLETESGEEEA